MQDWNILVLKKQATPNPVQAFPINRRSHLAHMAVTVTPSKIQMKKFKVYPYTTATAKASKNRQSNLRIAIHKIISRSPCIMYSLTPTLKNELIGLSASKSTNAGAAIIETPRFALLHSATPNAAKIIPKSQRSSEDLLSFPILKPFRLYTKFMLSYIKPCFNSIYYIIFFVKAQDILDLIKQKSPSFDDLMS